jgi:peptidyl-tRNA hydrolase, PTH1 family
VYFWVKIDIIEKVIKMKLIVGLGNPGKEYEKTRHNIGFIILDELSQSVKTTFSYKSKFKGEITQVTIKGETVILLKPTTFMNLSGEAVNLVKKFYNINNEDILVVYDDLDLETGKVRFRQKGSAGGHNGIKSIISCINTENFHRFKIGIDRDARIPVVNYVLGKFTKEQQAVVNTSLSMYIDAIVDWIQNDILYVMNKYN